jgi:membrane protein required for colicin V production
MNFIDLVFIVLLVGILALGFFQGMIRMGVLILAYYLSVVLASLYFPMLGNFFYRQIGGQRFASEYIAFFVIMLVGFGLLALAGLYTFRYAHLPGKLQYVDNVGGVLLSLILAALVVGVLSVLLWNLLITNNGEDIDLPLFRMLGNGVRNSFLLSYFATYILPEAYNIVEPILPAGAQVIFEV